MMNDLAYSLNSSKNTKNLQMLIPKQRMQSAPTIKPYKHIPEEGAPQSLLCSTININYDYLTSPFVQNVKSIQKLSNLVSSYFDTDTPEGSIPSTPYSSSEWMSILQDRNPDPAEKERIQGSLRDGLPSELRRKVWLYLAETEKAKKENMNKGITYQSLRKQHCKQEEKIKLDIGRSRTDDEFCQSELQEESIHQILKAYANFDPEVGYTQGMNFIVAVLLSFIQGECLKDLENKKQVANNEDPLNRLETTEEEVFWILVYIMQAKEWRQLFLPSIPKLKTLLDVLDVRVKAALPELYIVIQKYNCLALCFIQYFLTIMIYKSPPDLAKRILEVFLIEGEEILLHVIVKALCLCEKEIRDKEDSDELFPFLKDHLFEFISK